MSKVTSLSAQLKRLQVPQTSILSKIGSDTRRASFLFDPKEAASLDAESVYCIGMNGLEQLKAIDRDSFSSFESTLFASSSVTYERIVQTREANEKLDAELRRFLLHLAPYFMLKPAHKCFEWLVYKYKIHVYNVSDMFACILAYHETNYFVRAIQLVDFELEANSMWSWLVDNQKLGTRLASSTLATHLFSDLTLFNFVIDCLQANLNEFADWSSANSENDDDENEQPTQSNTQQLSPHNATCLNFLFSFLSKLLLESVKQLASVSATSSKKNVNNKQQESFFALLLPLLFAGLKSDLVQYKQLAHLVLAFLFEKFTFNAKTVNKTLFCICKGVSYFRDKPSLDTESIECVKSAIVTMCLLVQAQLDHQELDDEEKSSLPFMKKNFFDKLIKNFSPPHLNSLLMSSLDELNQAYRVDKFLKCLLTRLAEVSVEFDTSDEESSKRVTLDFDRPEDDERQLTAHESNPYYGLLIKLLDLFNLNRSPRLVETLIARSFRLLVAQLELNKLPNLYVEYHLCDCIHRLESKYPILFDKALNLFLDPNNQELSKRGRSYLLNTISFKFNSLRSRYTFKYQQVDSTNDLNLVQSLSSPNASIRANSLKFLRTYLESPEKQKQQQRFQLDRDFIRTELDSKLRHDSSPDCLIQVLAFGSKLTDYFNLDELILDDRLVSVFTRAEATSDWDECRLAAIDLVFNQLYLKHADKKDEFLDVMLRVTSILFETNVSSVSVFERMRKSAFYSHVVSESHSSGGTENGSSPIKKFYPIKSFSTNGTSSITIITNGNGKSSGSSDTESETTVSAEGNELFEQFLQTSVKYMMARGRASNLIVPPKSFERTRTRLATAQANASLRLFDLVVYEVCVRLCTQSLFFTNASFYFNLALEILVNLVGDKSVFNLRLKKSSSSSTSANETDNNTEKVNLLSNYKYLVEKQTIRNTRFLESCFSSLFKSMSIQTSNFVTSSLKPEIEKSLNRLYAYLCELASTNGPHVGLNLLNKFVESSLFDNHSSGVIVQPHTPSTTPTKLTSPQASQVSYSFFQFAFKFLINYDQDNEDNLVVSTRSTQLQTIRLYEAHLEKLLEVNKRTEGWFLISCVLALAWCLTSKSSQIRLGALDLVEKLNKRLDDNDYSTWKLLLKKLLKHKEEIEMDGGDYIRTKLNKIMMSDEKLAVSLIDHLQKFLSISLRNGSISNNSTSSTSPRPQHLVQFSSNLDASSDHLDIKCLVLVKFKLILLHLFAYVDDELKLKLMESVFGVLITSLNESSSLMKSGDASNRVGLELKLNKSLLALIVDPYLLNTKSYLFFNKHEKYFDYLVGYLNNNSLDKSAHLLIYFKHRFMSKLGAENERKLEFWSRLQARIQIDMLLCMFDLWLANSSRSVETSLVTSESIQENIAYLDSIKQTLLSFKLTAQHYVCLFVERANMEAMAPGADPTVNTTKEMRKQLKKVNGEKKVEWRSIRLVLDLLHSKLIKSENEMEVDENANMSPSTKKHDADLIDLIPYLFKILDSLETKYLSEINTVTTSPSSSESSSSADQHVSSADCLLLESMCLGCLLAVYRVNKVYNKQRLESTKFNIELLMQILQTKPHDEDDEEEKSANSKNKIKSIDRLNVQQNILILLSEIASIFPDKVLEHVLIMFVFVGNKLTRKDDSYSFQIINQIIKSILPAIVASCIEEQQQFNTNNSNNNTNSRPDDGQKGRLTSTVNTMHRHQKQLPYVSSLVCKILQSFVVALPHIPAHRKTIIFQNLMSIIGLNDYLWITLIQSIDHYLVQSADLLEFKTNLEEFTNKQKVLLANGAAITANTNTAQVAASVVNEKKLRNTLMQCIESMIALHVQFEPNHVIKSTIYLTTFLNKYLTKLFEKSKNPSSEKSSIKPGQKQIYSHLACQLDFYNQQQMKYLSYSMLTFVNETLNSPELVAKLADEYTERNLMRDDGNEYSSLFETLIERILMLVLNLSNEEAESSDDTMKKFEKTLLMKSYELLERAIQLLDSRQFIEVVRRLLKHELMPLRRRALNLLNARLRKHEPSESEISLLITLVDDLLNAIVDVQTTTTTSTPTDESSEIEVNNQTVLFCLKLLCKRIGERNPLAFVKVVKYVSENLLDKSLYLSSSSIRNVNLLSGVLLLCGELCLKLKSNALVYLNQIVSFDLDVVDFVRGKLESSLGFKPSDEEQLVDEFEESKKDPSERDQASRKFLKRFKSYELLILSCATCLQKIVSNMSNFVSPFLPRLLYVCCSLSHLTAVNQVNDKSSDSDDLLLLKQQQLATITGNTSGSSLSQLDAKLALLRSTLATHIPLRLLAPILTQQSTLSVESSSNAEFKMRLKYVEFYMQIARLAIKQSNHEDLLSNIKAIRAMFMNLFDLRTNMSVRLRAANTSMSKKTARKLDGFLAGELGKYENYVVGAFCEFTFKLSEDLFRPVFFKLYEWSSVHEAPTDRLITFYACTLRLSDKLKSLFVMFAPQFVHNSAELLNQLNSAKTDNKLFESSKTYAKEHLLLVNVVDTLSNVFLHDTQRTFVNKERFNVLMEPLVDQIENEAYFHEASSEETNNPAAGQPNEYRKFVSQHLAPCIGNFASCCRTDDALVRKFNYQILLKTKHSSVQVRIASLEVLNTFSKRIGDIYNSYLPETVPFLAELMEDPVEEVEEQVQSVIREMEDMLGESLQSHFV